MGGAATDIAIVGGAATGIAIVGGAATGTVQYITQSHHQGRNNTFF